MKLVLPTMLVCLLLLTGCMDAVQGIMQRRNQPRDELLAPDGIRIVLCGTNAPLPNPDRAEACTAVFVAGEMLLFDAGDGAVRSMGALRLPVNAMSNIFLTHLHDDHTVELSHAIHRTWMMGRTTEITVHGPFGTGRLVTAHNLFNTLDRKYRVDHHGIEILDPRYDIPIVHEITLENEDQLRPVYTKGDLVVSAFLVDHSPIAPAFGYRIDYRGRKVVISGDTIATRGLEKHSQGADVLISEVMNKDFVRMMSGRMADAGMARNAKMLSDILDYHVGTDEIGALAERAGVKQLVLTHLVPGIFNPSIINYFMFERPVAKAYSGDIVVGVDGSEIELPLGG
jgi:ribonuclease Z